METGKRWKEVLAHAGGGREDRTEKQPERSSHIALLR